MKDWIGSSDNVPNLPNLYMDQTIRTGPLTYASQNFAFFSSSTSWSMLTEERPQRLLEVGVGIIHVKNGHSDSGMKERQAPKMAMRGNAATVVSRKCCVSRGINT